MRPFLARLMIGLALGFGLLVVTLPRTNVADAAQADAKSSGDRVKFDTADSAELQGTFYPGTNKSPCAMLIHPIGENSHLAGWDELAKALLKEKFAVLSFDLRGHGDSTGVGQSFWYDPTNLTLKSAKSSKSKDKVNYKDFTQQQHYLMMVNDIAAAKRYLDRKNDEGLCNSSNLILIGADSGATLGAYWLSYAWNHPRTIQVAFGQVPTQQMEGQDVIGAVWLSISPKLNTFTVPVSDWLGITSVKEKVPMLFLCGEKDKNGALFSKRLYDKKVNSISDKKLKELSVYDPIKEVSLRSRELLADKSLSTVETIRKYAVRIVETRGNNGWVKREVERTLPHRIAPLERLGGR